MYADRQGWPLAGVVVRLRQERIHAQDCADCTSATGFIGAQRLRTLYVIVGAFAGVSSLVIGLFFIAGLGNALPDLQELLFGHRG